jgi:hypothetical protein
MYSIMKASRTVFIFYTEVKFHDLSRNENMWVRHWISEGKFSFLNDLQLNQILRFNRNQCWWFPMSAWVISACDFFLKFLFFLFSKFLNVRFNCSQSKTFLWWKPIVKIFLKLSLLYLWTQSRQIILMKNVTDCHSRQVLINCDSFPRLQEVNR